MAEVAANLVAIVEEESWKIVQPPSGPMSEVGHYHLLAKRNLKSKELGAIQHLLDEVAYNVAAMIFALLDGKLEGDDPLPRLTSLTRNSGEPLAESLHAAFLSAWEGGDQPDESDTSDGD